MLTILEAVQRDEALDVDGRDQLYQEALELIGILHGLPDDVVGKATAEQILADLKVQDKYNCKFITYYRILIRQKIRVIITGFIDFTHS